MSYDPEGCLYGDWMPWYPRPPQHREYSVIEWVRTPGDPRAIEATAEVANLAVLLGPHNAAWNIVNVWWRPVL